MARPPAVISSPGMKAGGVVGAGVAEEEDFAFGIAGDDVEGAVAVPIDDVGHGQAAGEEVGVFLQGEDGGAVDGFAGAGDGSGEAVVVEAAFAAGDEV